MPSDTPKARHNIYETITNKILAAIESNPGDPVMPWQRGGARPVLPTNAHTGQAYRGVNILSLWVTALERDYSSGEWSTLRQWNEKGATVRKGEKASPIVFYREMIAEPETLTKGDNAEPERRFLARGYWVFAAEQVEGYEVATALPPNPIERIATADAYFAATGASIVIGGAQACYRPSTDTSTCRTKRASSRRTGAPAPNLGMPCSVTRQPTGSALRTASTATSASASAMTPIASRKPAPSLAPVSSALASASRPSRTPTMRATSATGSTWMKASPRALFAAAAKAQEAVAYLDDFQKTAAEQAAA